MTSRIGIGLARIAMGVVLAAAACAAAFANDALKGTWVGTVGSNAVTLTIQSAQGGTLTGSIKGGTSLNYAVSGAPPSAANGQGTFQGNSVSIKTPGGTWAMQLQANQLKGRYTPDSTGARARRRDRPDEAVGRPARSAPGWRRPYAARASVKLFFAIRVEFEPN